jgi:hypothetical protein
MTKPSSAAVGDNHLSEAFYALFVCLRKGKLLCHMILCLGEPGSGKMMNSGQVILLLSDLFEWMVIN